MTIFRMVRHLEGQGHRVSIWVTNPARKNHDADLEDVLKYFQPISAKVLPLDSSFHFATGDCIIATAWQTVDFVKILLDLEINSILFKIMNHISMREEQIPS